MEGVLLMRDVITRDDGIIVPEGRVELILQQEAELIALRLPGRVDEQRDVRLGLGWPRVNVQPVRKSDARLLEVG